MRIIEVIQDNGDGTMIAKIDTVTHISANPVFEVVSKNQWMYKDRALTKPVYELTKGESLELMACDVDKEKNVGIFRAMGRLTGWVSLLHVEHRTGDLGLRVPGTPK